MNPGPTELEAKLALADPAALRTRLAGLGAACVASFEENNRFFDRPGDALRRADAALRLRTETPLTNGPDAGPPRHVLTFKGPRDASAAAAGLKSRPEVEAAVADAGDTAAVLTALGYTQRFRFEKRRQRHLLGGCRVELDELPGLGFFVEVEGPDAASIDAAIHRLGLPGVLRETRGYLALLLERGDPDGSSDNGSGPAFLFSRAPAVAPPGA